MRLERSKYLMNTRRTATVASKLNNEVQLNWG